MDENEIYRYKNNLIYFLRTNYESEYTFTHVLEFKIKKRIIKIKFEGWDWDAPNFNIFNPGGPYTAECVINKKEFDKFLDKKKLKITNQKLKY
jgi:hypothetical protein